MSRQMKSPQPVSQHCVLYAITLYIIFADDDGCYFCYSKHSFGVPCSQCLLYESAEWHNQALSLLAPDFLHCQTFVSFFFQQRRQSVLSEERFLWSTKRQPLAYPQHKPRYKYTSSCLALDEQLWGEKEAKGEGCI